MWCDIIYRVETLSSAEECIVKHELKALFCQCKTHQDSHTLRITNMLLILNFPKNINIKKHLLPTELPGRDKKLKIEKTTCNQI